MGSHKNSKLIGLYFNIIILAACTSTASTPGPGNAKDIAGLNKRLNQQAEQIEKIEQKLISYQTIFDNHYREKDEINHLKNELKTTLEKFNTESLEQDFLNTLNRVQKKIQILEDKTFYTDSLYFEIVNDMVLVEDKISSLILSFKEMNELSVNKTNKAIPQITDEEYTA